MAKNNQNTEIKQNDVKTKTAKKSRHIFRWIVILAVVVSGVYAYFEVQTWFYGDKYAKENSKDSSQLISDLQKTYDEKITQIALRVAALENELVRFENNSGDSVRIDTLRKDVEIRFADMEANFANSINALVKTNTEQPLPVMDKETKIQQELLLAMGTMVIRDLAERGLPFAYETEVLRVMAQGNESAQKYADVMQKYATSGIKGKKMLISEFNDLYPHLSQTEVKAKKTDEETNTENLPWWEKVKVAVINWTRNLFASKKTGEIPVLDAKKDKVFELVNDGDLAAALNELNTKDTYSKLMNEPLKQWIYQVQLYLDFEKAVSGLLMNSLANLHIKEMEH